MPPTWIDFPQNDPLTFPYNQPPLPSAAMDTCEWFDESTYSDLTIKLSNGTEIKVHKVIVVEQMYTSASCVALVATSPSINNPVCSQ